MSATWGKELMTRRWLWMLALVLSTALRASAPEGSIKSFIDGEMPASAMPGVAYAVVADGEITSMGARGMVRDGGDRKITPDTPFLTGSISKSFTALAVMQLVEARKIDLDAKLSDYLEGFSGRPAGVVTIRQLLSHTSGFSTWQGNTAPEQGSHGKNALAERVEQLDDVTPAYKPGARWEYSNTNYQILGRVIEVVSGQTYQVYVATHILQPVGMTHSFVADGKVHAAMATGHRPWFGTEQPMPATRTDRATAPQGGIVASASDLARYLRMMMNGEDDVLSAADKALMMRPASKASPFYGFGWFIDSGNGTVWHAGTSPGFETLATMIPSQKKAVVVLVNAGSGLGFAETAPLRDGITARALGLRIDGEGSQWPLKALFIGLVLLPIFYVLSMVWAWLFRDRLRAKARSGLFGMFSLWFPLLTTLAASWCCLILVPSLNGAPLGTVMVYQPDLGWTLIANAVIGPLWAAFRLGLAYTGKSF
ncbi:MAG: serine hydrolase domain-containing protein [Rhodanobacteraceae bacterium]